MERELGKREGEREYQNKGEEKKTKRTRMEVSEVLIRDQGQGIEKLDNDTTQG